VEKDDEEIRKRIWLEQFRIRQAEAKITKIQDDQLTDASLFRRQEAIDKIEELRRIIDKANGEIAGLHNIAQADKQSQETVEMTRRVMEHLRDINLRAASFKEKTEFVAKLGASMYPSEDLTYVRIFCE
jgi:hypothetical protein